MALLGGFPRIKRAPNPFRRISPIAVAVLGAATAVVVGVLLLFSADRPRTTAAVVADAEVVALLPRFRAPPAKTADSAQTRAAALLGQRLFSDRTLSKNGDVACASCHDPTHAFADGKPVSRGAMAGIWNTPTLVNTYLAAWFGWDGGTDSLAATALAHWEDPRAHGSSRGSVVATLVTRYNADYAAAFGLLPPHFPTSRIAELATGALPAPRSVKIGIDVAAHGLATLGDFSILTDVLAVAESKRIAPAAEFGRRALWREPVEASWVATLAPFDEPQRRAIDAVFANGGRALAAYLNGLSGVESPFDRFAARVAAGASLKDSLDVGFGATELAGFKVFVGRGRCIACHDGPAFSDQQFHNVGLSQQAERRGGPSISAPTAIEIGRAAGVLWAVADPFNCAAEALHVDPDSPVAPESCRELPFLDSQNLDLVGAFKTPSLRLVDLTAPYMHDGRFATLAEVVEYYNDIDMHGKPACGHRDAALLPLHLSDEMKIDLVSFLRSLTSPIRDANAPARIDKEGS